MAQPSSIFVSYRRDESKWAAGRLRDQLIAAFGRSRIFTDVDNIGPGQDFTKVLSAAVDNCRILLAIIGPEWVNAVDEAGHRRLEDPHDWVRFEIETALSRPEVLVIPILTDNAPMPEASDLPGELAQLCLRQAYRISAEGFTDDANGLIAYLRDSISPAPQQDPGPGAPGYPAVAPVTRTPPLAVRGYPVLPDEVTWSAPVTGGVAVQRVTTAEGAWVKIGDPLFVLRTGTGAVTLWSAFIGQVEALAYREGEALVPGRPLLTLAVSGWLFRPRARMPFHTGVLLASGRPSPRLDPGGGASRLLLLTDQAASRPVPWHSTCLLYVPVGTHVLSAIYELHGSITANTSRTMIIHNGKPSTLLYEAPLTRGGTGRLRS